MRWNGGFGRVCMVAGVVGLAIVLAACSGSDEDELTVFAAASLRSVVAELEAAWSAEHPNTRLIVASEASNVLAAQIAEGAPADVFLSADTLRPGELAASGLTAGQPQAFARNRLALVVRADDEAVQAAADLARPGLRIVGISEGAPIARYTQAAIEALGSRAGVAELLVDRWSGFSDSLKTVALTGLRRAGRGDRAPDRCPRRLDDRGRGDDARRRGHQHRPGVLGP